MRHFFNNTIVVHLLCALFWTFPALMTPPSGHGQSLQSIDASKTRSSDQKQGPIADSTQYLAATAKDRARQVENNNHPGGQEIKELPAGVSRLPEFWDEVGERKPLPVKNTDAIFTGEVTRSAALFSTDRNLLFSTFDVKVSQVLLNRLGEAIQEGMTAELERYGGRVRYPDGKIEEIDIDGRKLPYRRIHIHILCGANPEEGKMD